MSTCCDIFVSNWENDISQAKTFLDMVFGLCAVLQFEKRESKEIMTCTNSPMLRMKAVHKIIGHQSTCILQSDMW